ncbi:MAG: hypothetical protein LBQ75_00150 [Zoogloeaceae bacterium]|jgi:hypothetical protein|nr:hypothetical protein [Zoogloeaceae bacterium]
MMISKNMTPSLIFPPPAENRAALPAALLAAFVLGWVLCSFIYAVIALLLALVMSLSATVVGVDLLTPYSACSRP